MNMESSLERDVMLTKLAAINAQLPGATFGRDYWTDEDERQLRLAEQEYVVHRTVEAHMESDADHPERRARKL